MTPREWISKLKSEDLLHESNKTKENFFLWEKENFDNSGKLNQKVVKTSLNKLQDLQESYLNHLIEEEEFIIQTNEIEEITLYWITTSELKKSHSFKFIFQKIAFVLSFILSFFLIGIPFFLKLKKREEKYARQLDQLKIELFQAKEKNIKKMIEKKLENLPGLIKKIGNQFTDHRRLELINFQMSADWQEDENIPQELNKLFDAEFESDLKKGASFLRIDRIGGIEDKEPLPSFKLEGRVRAKSGADLLNALIVLPEDRPWATVLQLAVSHAILVTAFKAALSAFNIEVGSISWETNGSFYSIKAIFSEQFPPVVLEIIRDLHSKKIESVNVKVQGSADIVCYNTSLLEEPFKTLVKGAITEELKYSIILKENGCPEVIDLHSQMSVKK